MYRDASGQRAEVRKPVPHVFAITLTWCGLGVAHCRQEGSRQLPPLVADEDDAGGSFTSAVFALGKPPQMLDEGVGRAGARLGHGVRSRSVGPAPGRCPCAVRLGVT